MKKARIDKMVSLRLSKKDSATIDEIRNRLAEPLAALGIKATRHAAMKHALLVGLALFEEDLEEFKRRYVRSAQRRLEGVLLETSNERAVQWQRYTRLHDNLQILRDRVTQAQRERDEAVSEARRYLDERDEAMRIAAQNLAGAEDASKYVAELEAEVERLRARVHSDICGTVCVCGQDARAEVTDADA